MQKHAIARLIALRVRLKQGPSASEVDDVVSQINTIMHMLLKQQVFVDFVCSANHEHTVLHKLTALIRSAQNLKDQAVRADTCEELQCVMSACMNSTLLDSSYAPLPCNGMSAGDRLEHVRSGLALAL
jgi:hypothetical protein